MNERNDQNINGYQQPVIPETSIEPVSDFEPVPAPSTPVPPVNQTLGQPTVAPTQPEPVTTQQPTVGTTPLNYPSTGMPVGPNPFPTSEPVVNPETSFATNSLENSNPTAEPTETTSQPVSQPTIEPVIKPQVSVEKTVNEIMEKPAKKEKKSRHKKKVDEDWDEKPKKKGHGILIFVLILTILGLGGYIAYDKGLFDHVMSKKTETEPKEEEKTPVEEPVQKAPVTDDSTLYFISPDQKTSLILGKEVSKLKSFVLVLAQGENYQSVTGSYEIKDNQIVLTIGAGCLDATSNFTCTLPQGLEAVNNGGIVTITLNYTDEKILLGNIELINDKNNQSTNEIPNDTTEQPVDQNKNLTTQ